MVFLFTEAVELIKMTHWSTEWVFVKVQRDSQQISFEVSFACFVIFKNVSLSNNVGTRLKAEIYQLKFGARSGLIGHNVSSDIILMTIV